MVKRGSKLRLREAAASRRAPPEARVERGTRYFGGHSPLPNVRSTVEAAVSAPSIVTAAVSTAPFAPDRQNVRARMV